MGRIRQFSLQQQLLLPFVLLVVLISAAIVTMSYRAGSLAVDDMARKFLLASSDRIGKASEQHMTDAMAVLESVSPDPAMVPDMQLSFNDYGLLERRFWIASGLFPDINSYVYFGGADGSFVGVDREFKGRVEVYERRPGDTQRKVFRAATPAEHSLLRTDDYDPRLRMWYQRAVAAERPVWSPVYTDYTTKEPVITLAKPIYRGQHQLVGVLATDVTLRALTEFLRTLDVGKHGIAFVMDTSGLVVATSGMESPIEINPESGVTTQRKVTNMGNPLMRAAADRVASWRKNGMDLRQSVSGEVDLENGRAGVSAVLTGATQDIDWITVIAMPRNDFMGGVTRSAYESAVSAAICVVAGLLLGWLMVGRVLRDIRQLTTAARKIGNGEPMPELSIESSNEIGELAQTFSTMEVNLRTDRLTGVGNREWLNQHFNFLQRQSRHNVASRSGSQAGTQPGFALLFVDMDNFKPVNDRYGHTVGDQVLITVADRLRESVRQTDLVARYGGDEFVVLLKSVQDGEGVAHAVDKIRHLMQQPITIGHELIKVSASLGWAIFPHDGEDMKSLLKAADGRMFDDKKARKAAR